MSANDVIDDAEIVETKLSSKHRNMAIASLIFNVACAGLLSWYLIPVYIKKASVKGLFEQPNSFVSLVLFTVLASCLMGVVGSYRIIKRRKYGLIIYTLSNVIWIILMTMAFIEEIQAINFIYVVVPSIFTIVFLIPPRPVVRN